jgi:hypothetical protein
MPSIIVDRAEFVEVLRLLQVGHTLVLLDDHAGYKKATIDGMIVYHSVRTLLDYELIHEYENARGFPNTRYFKITVDGGTFATRVIDRWKQLSFIERCMIRWHG